MTELSKVSTVELARELLKRAEHTDALLALVDAGRFRENVQPTRKRYANGGARISLDAVLEALRDAGRPLTSPELSRRVPKSTAGSISAHMSKAVKAGRVIRLGTNKPHAYAIKEG